MNKQLFEEFLPFGHAFKVTWMEWMEYRRQAKYKKYTEIGLRKTFKKLILFSENDEDKAIQMLERAMENNWQGFNFKLPDNGTNKQNTGSSKQQAASNFLEQARERHRLITGGS